MCIHIKSYYFIWNIIPYPMLCSYFQIIKNIFWTDLIVLKYKKGGKKEEISDNFTPVRGK